MEIEKKYRLGADEKESMIAALAECGATFRGEEFEENILFASPELLAKGAVLRLRRIDQKTVLTYKQKLAPAGDAKRHVEHETTVEDFEVAARIFESLGYRRSMVYEKRRRTWDFRSVEVVVDELPFGDFMEIEGSITGIAEAEMLLGADELTVEHRTYPVLTAAHGITVDDVVEARFEKQ